MRLSIRVQYGFRMLCQLSCAYATGPLQMRDLAEREGISEKYLGQIMLSLRSSGIVSSLRGPRGGYYLSKPPRSITLKDAFQALDGEVLRPEESESAHSGGAAADTGEVVGEIWARLGVLMEGMLGGLTLQDLADLRVAKQSEFDYAI